MEWLGPHLLGMWIAKKIYEEKVFERKYCLVIDNKLNMNLDELEMNLIDISKEYNDRVYVKGQYLDSLNVNGFYPFMYDKKSFLIDVQDALRERGISFRILTKKEFYIYNEEWVNKSDKQKQKIINNVLFFSSSTSNKNDKQK